MLPIDSKILLLVCVRFLEALLCAYLSNLWTYPDSNGGPHRCQRCSSFVKKAGSVKLLALLKMYVGQNVGQTLHFSHFNTESNTRTLQAEFFDRLHRNIQFQWIGLEFGEPISAVKVYSIITFGIDHDGNSRYLS